MKTCIKLDNTENQYSVINNFFKNNFKIRYNRKLSGKIKLYVSDRNTIKNITGVLSLYQKELQ